MVTERDPTFDMESADSEFKEDPRNEQVTGSKRVENVLRSLGLTLSFKGSGEGEDSSNSDGNSMKTSDVECNDIESLINNEFVGEKRENRNMPLMAKTQSKEKHKVRNSKKAPKPPRPRKGPSLTTSDLRLVKEISELVMKKRARIERLKSLKKMRSARSSSSSSSSTSSSSASISLFAMIITVVVLIVIIFQGFRSRKTGVVLGQFDFKHSR